MRNILFILTFTVSIHAQYAGRYTNGKDYAVYFEQTKYGLTIRPVLWTATQLLTKTSKDNFVVVDRTSRSAEFLRDATGRVTGVVIHGMDGEGLALRRETNARLPVELLLADRIEEAARGYLSQGDEGRRQIINIAAQVRSRLPTKTALVISFLQRVAPEFQANAEFHKQLGLAFIQSGDRLSAREELLRALQLAPDDRSVTAALDRFDPQRPTKRNDGWKMPFALSAVFSKPTPSEILAVEAEWSSRDLQPKTVKEEFQKTITLRGWNARVRIVSHIVLGSRHYGAIIIPKDAKPGCCPVIIDAKGVSPTYFPLDLERIESPPMMGPLADRFIYVVPSYRGEVMKFGDKTFTSEGDRRDALDGATDDAIALLNVALETTPEADSDRVCIFGRSRGGTVAMLAGIRDKRIDCVVNVSGPTDWFYLMGTEGWTEQELWSEAIRNRAKPTEPGGQNVERFLGKAIDGEEDLDGVRRRMIASSPLYFAAHLPPSQHHYGLEDTSVPSANGYEIVKKLNHDARSRSHYQAFFYPGQGHDTDRLEEPIKARSFIANALGVK